MLRERLVVRMGEEIAGTNWHTPETRADIGQFRWTGPGEQATVNVSLQRGRELMAVVAYQFPLLKEQLTKLHVEVDGVRTPHVVREDVRPKSIVFAIPARRSGNPDATRIAIVLPRTVAPSTLSSDNADTRLLGLAVSSIVVLPLQPALPGRLWLGLVRRLMRRAGLPRRGWSPGDFPFSHFDGLAYLKSHPEAAKAVVSGAHKSALAHYLATGRTLGRSYELTINRLPNEGGLVECFDGLSYLQSFPDVADAIRLGRIPSALDHYINHGRHEGRAAPTRFDGAVRLGTMTDLARMDLDAIRAELERTTGSVEQLSKGIGRVTRISRNNMEQVQQQLLTLARARQMREHDLQAKVNVLESALAAARRDLRSAVTADGLATLQQELLLQLDQVRGTLQDVSLHRDAREHHLLAQVDSLKQDVSRALGLSAVAARADEVAGMNQELQRALEQLRNGMLSEAAAREGSVQSLGARLESMHADIESARDAASRAAQADDIVRLQRGTLDHLGQIRSELATASSARDTREHALVAQIEALRASVTKLQDTAAGAARPEELERLRRDAARDIERVRGDVAAATRMRESREQVVQEQIELLRVNLDESLRKLSATARAEDVDRIRRDAALDIERARNEMAAMATVDKARTDTLLSQIESLKSAIGAAQSRAEVAELKVASAERALGSRATRLAESVERSLAGMDSLRDELADQRGSREAMDSVIRSEIEILKGELSIAQMGNVLTKGSATGKAGTPARSWSQLGQDVWVLEQSGFKKAGFFVDIGATDGVLLSNTYLLETQYRWKGICVEPDPKAFSKLAGNRKAVCLSACLWSSTGEEMDFILAGEYGALDRVADEDHHSGKRSAYRKIGETVRLRTTSLNDLLQNASAPAVIDYISLDTEGSEYEILSTFDFSRWKVKLWTIEHNQAAQRERIFQLMTGLGYQRREVKFDDWYYL